MGVQVYAGMLAQQPRRHVQLFRGAGRGEARGHRVEQTALAVPALDQRLAVAVAALGGVGQVVRRVAVHHHLAGDQAQVQAPGGLEQRFHRLPVHAAEDQRGGGAVAQQFLQEDLGDLVGMGLVTELALGGEGIGVQPVQQLFAVGGDHPGLREMDVGIDEAGGDQRVAVLEDLDVADLAEQGFGVTEASDLAVLHQQQAVLEVFVGAFDADLRGVGDAVQDGGAVGFGVAGHGSLEKGSWRSSRLAADAGSGGRSGFVGAARLRVSRVTLDGPCLRSRPKAAL